MKDKKLLYMAQGALIATLYVVLTMIFAPISFSQVQVRIAEALTILPVFTPAAIPGLFIGCLLGNALGGAVIVDVIAGSIATLIGAIGTYLLSRIPSCKKNKGAWICTLPPVIANGLIIPFVLKYAYELPNPIWQLAAGVVAGEIICCCILGGILLYSLRRTPIERELSAAE